jgi:uncharacterized protein YcbK (DUF882 family)
MGDRSKNFSNSEFKCKCGDCAQIFPPDDLIVIAQDVRDHFNAPVTVHSGHRCPAYNARVGGASKSQHLEANGADMTVKGVSPFMVQEYLLEKYPDQHGIGRYDTFTHIDVRGYKARWDKRKRKAA